MSDLLTRFVTALESIADSLQKGSAKVSATSAAPTKSESTADDSKSAAAAAALKKAAADKVAADKAAAEKKAAATASGGKGTPAPATAPAGTTKSPGGKRTLDDVRAKIRAVATTDGLGKTDAVAILEEEGGVKTVAELKPENYDAVFEACEVAIANAGKPAAATEGVDDLM